MAPPGAHPFSCASATAVLARVLQGTVAGDARSLPRQGCRKRDAFLYPRSQRFLVGNGIRGNQQPTLHRPARPAAIARRSFPTCEGVEAKQLPSEGETGAVMPESRHC
jgi:hypothetical protein